MARAVSARRGLSRWSIARRLCVVQLAATLLGGAIAVVAMAADERHRATEDAAQRSIAVARSIADNPFVIAQVQTAHPTTLLQPYAVHIMTDASVDFITIMNVDGTRYTHPNPAQIGGKFIGTTAPALEGRTFTETYTGTLGPSVRAVTPIRGADGAIVALVAAGVTLKAIDSAFWARLAYVALTVLVLVAITGATTGVLSAYLRRVTGGRDPEQLGQLFNSYETVLHTVEEGLLLVDDRDRVVVVGDYTRELLGLTPVTAPTPVHQLPLSPPLAEVLSSRNPGERLVATADRVLIAAVRPAVGRTGGRVVTLRDRTELQRITGELESMRTMSQALRAQAHEFSNRLHTIVSLLELGRSHEALLFAASEMDLSQRLVDRVIGEIDEPVIVALLLGKSAVAGERGIELHLDMHLEPGLPGLDPATLVSVIGNLVDNALEAAADAATPESPGWVEVYLGIDGDDLVIQVSDSGPGVADPQAAFSRGWSTKGTDGRGIGLAVVDELVRGLGGTIEVTRHVGAVFTVSLPLPVRTAAGAVP